MPRHTPKDFVQINKGNISSKRADYRKNHSLTCVSAKSVTSIMSGAKSGKSGRGWPKDRIATDTNMYDGKFDNFDSCRDGNRRSSQNLIRKQNDDLEHIDQQLNYMKKQDFGQDQRYNNEAFFEYQRRNP